MWSGAPFVNTAQALQRINWLPLFLRTTLQAGDNVRIIPHVNKQAGGNTMTQTKLLWIALAVTYAAFFSWYTSFGGPLTAEEQARYMNYFKQSQNGDDPVFLARMHKFMAEDTGDDFVMINAIDLYDTPLQVEGVEPGETSAAVLDKYMAYMTPSLFGRASHPVLFGAAAANAMDLMNADGMEQWTTGAGMRYRSRRDMLEIATNPEFRGAHIFKTAAMEKTIAFPLDPWFHLGDPRLLLALLLSLIGCALSWRWASTKASA